MAIATDGHGAPAATMRAGIIVKEKLAGRVGAAPDGCGASFDDQFGGGARNRGEEPFEAALAGDVLQAPRILLEHELVVALGDAQDVVDRFNPSTGYTLPRYDRGEDGTQGFAETQDAQEQGVNRLRLRSEKRPQAGGAFLGDEAGVLEKDDELIPGKIAARGRVGKIQGQTAGDEMGRRGHRVERQLTGIIQ